MGKRALLYCDSMPEAAGAGSDKEDGWGWGVLGGEVRQVGGGGLLCKPAWLLKGCLPLLLLK